MSDVLIYADTVRSPELRHEIPISITDPFLYLERNGDRHVVIGSLELPRARELPGLQVHALEFVDQLLLLLVEPQRIAMWCICWSSTSSCAPA